MNGRERRGECRQCGECCTVVRLTGILSHIVSQHGSLDEARLYYSFRGITVGDVDVDNDAVSFELNRPCSQLTAENTCALHTTPEKKPVICHRYPLYPDDIENCGYAWE